MYSLSRLLLVSSAVASSIAVSSCRDAPVKTVSSHPPAADLTCPVEPPAPTDMEIAADQFGDVERGYTLKLLLWGRTCYDTLVRNCQWHKDRGATEPAVCRSQEP